MDPFDREQLDELLNDTGGPHVSMILPAPKHVYGEVDDAGLLRRFTGMAHAELVDNWLDAPGADRLLEPLHELANDPHFRTGRRGGTVIYLSSVMLRIYRLQDNAQCRLVIAPSFYLRPMLPALEQLPTFHLLTLSDQGAALYASSSTTMELVEQWTAPMERQRKLSSMATRNHSEVFDKADAATRGSASTLKEVSGQASVEMEVVRSELEKIDDAVSSYLAHHRGILILAGIDRLTKQYKEISSFDRLIATTISGSVDHLAPAQLFQHAMPIAVGQVEQQRQADAAAIREHLLGPVETDAEKILRAAYQNRIEILFFDVDATLDGHFCPEKLTLQPAEPTSPDHPSQRSDDLIEAAAIETLRRGGKVYAVTADEMPFETPLVAALKA